MLSLSCLSTQLSWGYSAFISEVCTLPSALLTCEDHCCIYTLRLGTVSLPRQGVLFSPVIVCQQEYSIKTTNRILMIF